jgi:dTMP kinase
MHPYPGTLITFEGPEGGGKSTQSKMIVHWLESEGREVVLTHEPGGGSPEIRAYIMALNKNMPNLADIELGLFCMDRTAHYVGTVIPALERGAMVVCDRGPLSTLAYQGYARNPGNTRYLQMIRDMNLLATQGVTADVTIVLDMPTHIGLKRKHSAKETNRYEEETERFHNRVRHGFLEEAQLDDSIIVLDAKHTKEAVFRRVQQVIERVIPEKIRPCA